MIDNANEKISQCYHTALKKVAEIPVQGIVLAISLIALSILFPPFVFPACGIVIGILAGKTFVKIKESTSIETLDDIPTTVNRINEKFPKLKIIFIIFVLATSAIHPIVGVAAGASVGIYFGLVGFSSGTVALEERELDIESASPLSQF